MAPDPNSNFPVVFLSSVTTEAHARNEWPVGDPVKLDQPLTLQERFACADSFRRQFPELESWNICIDDPESGDAFDTLYSAWPTRFFVLDGREKESHAPTAIVTGEQELESPESTTTLAWRAEPHDDHEYKLEDLEQYLESL